VFGKKKKKRRVFQPVRRKKAGKVEAKAPHGAVTEREEDLTHSPGDRGKVEIKKKPSRRTK